MSRSLLAMLLLLSISVSAFGAETDWSEPVSGVRARLLLERNPKSPFLKVSIEFQNVSEVVGIKTLNFSPRSLAAVVLDESGNRLNLTPGAYDGMQPFWEPLKLPFDSHLKFRISFPGMGYQPNKDRTIIDLGSHQCWVIPDNGNYYLTGVVTIPKEEQNLNKADWHGSLTLPKIRIPNR